LRILKGQTTSRNAPDLIHLKKGGKFPLALRRGGTLGVERKRTECASTESGSCTYPATSGPTVRKRRINGTA